MKAAVIGAGLGGLSAAIRLANSGFSVDIFEQNDSAGGKAGNLLINGFRFDTGPSLLTMPFVLKELFESSGKQMENYIQLNELNPVCKYFYPDGTVINAYSDPDEFSKEIEKKTTDSAYSVKKYLAYCKNIYDLTADLFLYNNPSSIKTYFNLKAVKTLLRLNKIDPFRTMHQANSSFFHDKKTVQIFDRYATYNGSDPYRAPATLNIIPHVEYNLGAFIPRGGIFSISEALQKLCSESGVTINFNIRVEKILIKNHKAAGIVVNGQEMNYDLVISNVDVNYTYRHLLNDVYPLNEKKILKPEPSLSGIVFYWGVKGKHDNLETHNILFPENYKNEFDDIFTRKICPEDPTVYIYISSRLDEGNAPVGFENWFVMINTPYDSGQDWNEQLFVTRQRTINKINAALGIDLKNSISVESFLTPPMIEKYTGSIGGSIYGVSSNSKYSAFLRHPNKSRRIKGLYFCGGSVHPGGGIPLVILSGKIVSDLVKKNYAD